MTEEQNDLIALIRQIRTAFNRLKALAEDLHRDLGISPSMRAVLEALAIDAPQTVPEIAEARGVSRQHIQSVMNELLGSVLVQAEENPDHKRSVLYRLTATGERRFAEIRTREAAPLKALAEALPASDVINASRTLAQLNRAIETLMEKGN